MTLGDNGAGDQHHYARAFRLRKAMVVTQHAKEAMERLAGKKTRTSTSNQKAVVHSSSAKKMESNAMKSTVGNRKDNAKDILNRMKEVRAQYNNRSRNSAAKEKGIAAKVAQLTNQK